MKNILGIAAGMLVLVSAANAGTLTISAIYGGGGSNTASTNAPFKQDYIELYNPGSAAVSLSGLSLQYGGSTTATAFQASNIFSFSSTAQIAAKGYFLVVTGTAGSVGVAVPVGPNGADATATLNLSASAGRLALVNGTTGIVATGGHFSDPNVLDFVGFGSATTGYEGSAPTSSPSAATAIVRAGAGATDTNDNLADFTVVDPLLAGNGPRGSWTSAPVPEPATFAIFGLGLIGFAARRRRSN